MLALCRGRWEGRQGEWKYRVFMPIYKLGVVGWWAVKESRVLAGRQRKREKEMEPLWQPDDTYHMHTRPQWYTEVLMTVILLGCFRKDCWATHTHTHAHTQLAGTEALVHLLRWGFAFCSWQVDRQIAPAAAGDGGSGWGKSGCSESDLSISYSLWSHSCITPHFHRHGW